MKKPYILTTDASNYAIAGIFSQINSQGEEEIVTFVSRTLKNSEIKYFITEKEMLAIVWSVEKLRTYLRKNYRKNRSRNAGVFANV